MSRVLVPVEPIREALERATERVRQEYAVSPRTRTGDAGLIAPVDAVAREISGYTGKKLDTVQRTVFRIRNGYDHKAGRQGCVRAPVASVTFEIADEILCALGMVERWYTDPRLREVYELLGDEAA